MNFTREINRLMAAMMAAFTVMLLVAAYYGVAGSITLLPREDNPRLVEAEQSILRGGIYDRNGEPLAQTTAGEGGFAERSYISEAAYSALGYYSYRYGTSNAETAFDAQLSGANLPPTLDQLVLGRPPRGEDIQLTLDIAVQRRVFRAMEGYDGAAVVMTVPNGELLALVSLPTYDPNTLDDDWDTLIEAPGNPFFNRVLQGSYQPGTMMQLPVLLDAITRGQSLNAQFPSGASPVQLDDLTLSCVVSPPQIQLTLAEAYVYGCPAPFAQLVSVLHAERFQAELDVLRLQNPPTLAGFLPEQDSGGDGTDTPNVLLTTANMRENVLGQGMFNLSPMAVNAMVAAVANGGNTPQPRILAGTRPQGATEWIPNQQRFATIPYTTPQAATATRDLMSQSVRVGNASQITWSGQSVRGQGAIAYSGESTLVWFTGFARYTSGEAAVVTVILEDTADVAAAATVAREALNAANIALTR